MVDFLGIGAQKAGTTWLHANLAKHPGLFLPEHKELHFWNRNRVFGMEWYGAQFAAAPPAALKGEITPAYAILPPAVIAEVHAAFPRARLVYLLRNPIERAWSSALMALPRAEMTYEEASDTWFIDHFNSAGSLKRGDYEECLRNWRAVYPTEQILVDTFDEIVRDPRAVLRRALAHIGADTGFADRLNPQELSMPHNAGPGHPLRPSLRRYLHALYRPRIESLGRYIGRDLSAWLDGPVPAPGPGDRLRAWISRRAHLYR